MTTPEAHRCAKCEQIATQGWTRRCATCLTPDERMKIDQQAALAEGDEGCQQ